MFRRKFVFQKAFSPIIAVSSNKESCPLALSSVLAGVVKSLKKWVFSKLGPLSWRTLKKINSGQTKRKSQEELSLYRDKELFIF